MVEYLHGSIFTWLNIYMVEYLQRHKNNNNTY